MGSLFNNTAGPASKVLDRVFAEDCLYVRTQNAPVPFRAVFTENFVLVDASTGIPSVSPTFDYCNDQLSFQPDQGEIIIRDNGDRYEVLRPEPLDSGWTKLVTLRKR